MSSRCRARRDIETLPRNQGSLTTVSGCRAFLFSRAGDQTRTGDPLNLIQGYDENPGLLTICAASHAGNRY